MVGDATGTRQSSHLAQHQARLVVEGALGRHGAPFDLRLVPAIIYTDPELAEVGLTEPEARAAMGEKIRIVRAAFAESDKARILRDTVGIARLVLDHRGRILGAGVVGPGAGELIALLSLAIANGFEARHLGSFVAGYPTFSEIAHRLAETAAE